MDSWYNNKISCRNISGLSERRITFYVSDLRTLLPVSKLGVGRGLLILEAWFESKTGSNVYNGLGGFVFHDANSNFNLSMA